MKRIWNCRRTYLATLGILCLTGLGFFTKDAMAVAGGISIIVTAVAGANAYQKAQLKKHSNVPRESTSG